jgi:RNA polymerase sigma factor (sigma-70 family)
MPREQPVAILDPLRRLITRQSGSALSDAQLLENFVSRRDEASFEVLVWRHGAMVLALCKRILRDSHEAEDAFQATFLVFVRKAGSIGRGEVLAAWLYKVAYRIAIRLRAAAAKRTASNEPTDAIPAPEGNTDSDWNDLKPVLDDEIARLPEKYRAPFVLCYLEGRTNEEAAAQLGCPKGTVLSRLSRGRERLRDRLSRRGVALTAVAFAFTLSQNAASASVPAALVSPTVGAAIPFAAGTAAGQLVPASVAALAEGALQTMTLIKLKVAAAAALAFAMLGTGLAVAARGTGDGDSSHAPAAPVAAAPIPAPLPLNVEDFIAAPFEEDRERGERPSTAPAMGGRVVDVAKDGKSFTVETAPTERGGTPGKATVKLGDKAAVTYHGVGLNGAAPAAGYLVQVWFEGNSKEMAATVVFQGTDNLQRGGDVQGKLSEIANDGKSITFDLVVRGAERGVEVKKLTIPLDAKTVVSFSNVGKGEAKMTVGQPATVWYADDGKTAAKVQLIGSGEPGRREDKRPDLMGKVMRADDNGSKFVVEVPPANRGDEPTRVTITVAEKGVVLFNNVPADGAKAAPDMQVMVWLADNSKDTAAKVVFVGTVPERWTVLTGKVVAVSKDGKSFTVEEPSKVRGEEPKRTEVKLTDKSKVAFFGVGPGEAKVTEGMVAQVRLLDGSSDTASQAMFYKPGERGR